MLQALHFLGPHTKCLQVVSDEIGIAWSRNPVVYRLGVQHAVWYIILMDFIRSRIQINNSVQISFTARRVASAPGGLPALVVANILESTL